MSSTLIALPYEVDDASETKRAAAANGADADRCGNLTEAKKQERKLS